MSRARSCKQEQSQLDLAGKDAPTLAEGHLQDNAEQEICITKREVVSKEWCLVDQLLERIFCFVCRVAGSYWRFVCIHANIS